MTCFARSCRSSLLFALLLGAPLLPACTVHATVVDDPHTLVAVHPAYLHALSDLREARYNLERRGGDAWVRWDERNAVGEIDRAMAEIRQAAIDDGKNLEDHPPVDAGEPRLGRMHRALSALRAAREDIAREEDNAYANGLRSRAMAHIDEAIRDAERGLEMASGRG